MHCIECVQFYILKVICVSYCGETGNLDRVVAEAGSVCHVVIHARRRWPVFADTHKVPSRYSHGLLIDP